MKRWIKIFSLLAIVSLSFSTKAMDPNYGKYKTGGSNNSAVTSVKRGAGCAPANYRLKMEYNDVSCQLETGGLLFLDRANNLATYRVPRNGNVTAIYAGSLWMGGKDVNGQLKLAAVKFRNEGNDFWPGPLEVDFGTIDAANYDMNHPWSGEDLRPYGEATIDPDECSDFDNIFSIQKISVEKFITIFECKVGITPKEDCEDVPVLSNKELEQIYNWPGNGDPTRGQDRFLAPFYDFDKDNFYNPDNGDYPWYDDIKNRDDVECGADRRITLFGDDTHWWIFNDKGNTHTESKGEPIGMEIRAQAFSFTGDYSKMTFYNYELINRGTQTLFDTYFAQYVDADLGNFSDDYVGCDVTRGLGYIYNGDNADEATGGRPGYGANPPALGIDFFEGPYQDPDLKDNPGPYFSSVTKKIVVPTVADALANKGIVYSGLGIGYSDSIVDNERYGMRRFMYYTSTAAPSQADPNNPAQYYSYMQGKWADNRDMVYGGTGYPGSAGATTIVSGYAFPDNSDTLDWGTEGVKPGFAWSEITNNNAKGDRRFVQSAGPFTLKPGAVNNITVGIVYSEGVGDLLASVRSLKQSDTKAQALFDNCFRARVNPYAPKLDIVSLENELVLLLSNPSSSNNFNEGYAEEDKISIPESNPVDGTPYDRFYRFEGYQIYQLKDAKTELSDIQLNPEKVRLVAQCDKKNNVIKLVNNVFNQELGFNVPSQKVLGANAGIKHSFRMTTDAFTGEKLVNHKQYYYIAIAYAHNNYKVYDPTNPENLDGQKEPYISSDKGFDGGNVLPVSAIPASKRPTQLGTVINSIYGNSPRVTRLDGSGNSGFNLRLTAESENEIIKNSKLDNPTYEGGAGPVNIKVVDPLNVAPGHFVLKFNNKTVTQQMDSSKFVVYRYDNKGGTILDSVQSETIIKTSNEQIIPKWGISIQLGNSIVYDPLTKNPALNPLDNVSDLVENASGFEFSDSTKKWLSFVADNDLTNSADNWIRSGTYVPNQSVECTDATLGFRSPCCYPDELNKDADGAYNKLGRTVGVAPQKLVGYQCDYMPLAYPETYSAFVNARRRASISYLPSVDIVITKDTSKWTRCPVIELCRDANLSQGGAKAGLLRKSPSVGKNGLPDNTGEGMGWFPGYAIDLETGLRLQLAFGENSFLGGFNGNDMLWNPTDDLESGGINVNGGMHAIYVFGVDVGVAPGTGCPAYNPNSSWLQQKFTLGNNGAFADIFSSLMWIMNPVVAPGQNLLSSDVRIKVRVNKEFRNYLATGANKGEPMYEWNQDELVAQVASSETLNKALDEINVVPNPYYAYSSYERNQLDTRVKIVNLPEQCTVSIYNVSGKLMRRFKKDNSITSIDWDMKNTVGIPIVSGVYLIHVEVPNIGERVLKFFGGVRQVDLENL